MGLYHAGKDKRMEKIHETTNMEKGNKERGGVELRDYTQGSTASLQQNLKKNGVRGPRITNFDPLARLLIFASIGLGAMEILAPKRVQRIIGLRKGNYTGLIRLMGARELMSAFLIFIQPRPQTGVWSRVLGDLLDLGLLGAAFSRCRVNKNRLSGAVAFVASVTALDLFTAIKLGKMRREERIISAVTEADLKGRTRSGAFKAVKNITINRPPEEVYAFWRNFENLPQFMYHLESVQVLDDGRSHWVAKAPAGMKVSWDAEITEDVPNQRIAWKSTEKADVPNAGVVRFVPAPQDRGTEVQVEIEYSPPGGKIGKTVALLFGEEPGQQIKGDLNRFKQVMETGEMVRSEGSPHGMGQKLQHPARPLADHNKEEGKQRPEGKRFLTRILARE
jgi:uncharacterized membrane protein